MKESKSYSFYFLILFIGFQGISGLIGGFILLGLVILPSVRRTLMLD